MAAIAGACTDVDRLTQSFSPSSFENYLALHRPDAPGALVTLAQVEGHAVGFAYAHFDKDRDGEVRSIWTRCRVMPTWRRMGIGAELLKSAQATGRDHAALQPATNLPLRFETRVYEHEIGAIGLLDHEGYKPVRWLFEMVRPSLTDLPSEELPDGIEVRPVERAYGVKILEARAEATASEWYFPMFTPEALTALVDDPIEGQLDVWQVAWDGSEVVAGVLGYIDTEENEAFHRLRGYTESIFTRRPWRGRGIATALIGRNLRLLRERGMTEATLSVDADNRTGALRLYERCGFMRVRTEVTYARLADA